MTQLANSWETLPSVLSHGFSNAHIDSLCSVENYVYTVIIASTCEAFRCNPAKNIWQGGANFVTLKSNLFSDNLGKELIDVTASVSSICASRC